jgi:hypothetical protein
MIRFFGTIEDFWSADLKSYQFVNRYSAGQRSSFHKNYSNTNNDLLQGFDSELPVKGRLFLQQLKLTIGTVSWTCIEPGQSIPVHTDAFYKFRIENDIDISQCIRYLIFLQDWSFGHVVEFEELSLTKWKCGDVWVFDHNSKHFASNASNTDFITCQVNTIVNTGT